MDHKLPAPKNLVFEGNVAENWRRWLQQYRLFMSATAGDELAEKKQCATFLTLAGESAIEIYNTLTFTLEQKDKIEPLIEKFKEYCTPKKNVTYERHVFNSRHQKSDETFDQYVTDLKILAKDCEYDDLKDGILKDKIVEGVRNDALRARLLRESDLTLKKCLDMCKAAESTEKHMKTLSLVENPEHVDAVKYKFNAGRGRSRFRNNTRGRGRASNSSMHRSNSQHAAVTCSYCATSHPMRACPARGKNCNACGKLNHFAKACFTKSAKPTREKKVMSIEEHELFIDSIDSKQNHTSWMAPLQINGNIIPLKLDTGADVNILPKSEFDKLPRKPRLHKSDIKLKAYNAGPIKISGQCILTVVHKGHEYKVMFIVSQENVKPILGRKSCETLGLVRLVLAVESQNENAEPLDKTKVENEYSDLFTGLGCLPGKVKIALKPEAEPVIEACRKIPFALHDQLKEELDQMEKMNVIEKVEKPVEWVNSLVVVHKPNGKLRICLDPRSLNKYIKREHFKLPTREEIMSRFEGATIFSKLDASSGFWQIQLEDESADLCTFITPFGRYRFNRLPFGISSAPEIYHRIVHNLFEEIPGVDTSMDDIIIWGKTRQEHDSRIRAVLEKARSSNLKLNKEKCMIGVDNLTFLGDTITSEGVKPDPRKVEAIVNMERPTDRKELQRFLGMVNYLARFIKDLSRRTEPLRKLLVEKNQWQWNPEQETAFKKLKDLISQEPVLKFYEPSREIKISCDASQTGLGAVLLQNHNNEWLPVAYASRTVTECESRYAPIESETLALTYACERFHQYIYGRSFQAETDHKPLVAIFSKSFNDCPPRIQRLKLRLQKYDFTLSHTPGKLMYMADTLSRAPIKGDNSNILENEVEMFVNEVYKSLPVSGLRREELVESTQSDEILRKLAEVVTKGWPETQYQCQSELKPYWTFKEELSVVNGLILKGTRIVIPTNMRDTMLKKIHHGHLGREKCKKRARQVLYWPNMNFDIDNLVDQCEVCKKYSVTQQSEPLEPHPAAESPWERISTDLFSFDGKNFIVICDAFSNYPEVLALSSQTTNAVIQALKSVFARHGVPKLVVSDNGPCYSSREFKEFAYNWNFQHKTSSPHYPQSNGLSERTVQTVKNIFKKCKDSGEDINMALLVYRSTPMDNGKSPAEMLMGREIVSNLPLSVNKDTSKYSQITNWRNQQKIKQKKFYDNRHHVKTLSSLNEGNQVLVQSKDGNWNDQATVVGKVAPRSYLVNQGKYCYRRNRRHLKKVSFNFETPSSDNDCNISNEEPEPVDNFDTTVNTETEPKTYSDVKDPVRVTRTGRIVKKPDRLIEAE